MSIETINPQSFRLKSNQILVKLDPQYDIIQIDGPEGKKIELKLISFAEQEVNHYSISGTVIAKPETTMFFDRYSPEAQTMAQQEFASNMKESLDADVTYDFTVGDKVYFNYNVQLSAEEENRIVDTVEHGLCMLIHLNFLFGYERDNEVVPVNGYVFFVRDETPTEVQYKHGLIGIQKADPYKSQYGTVKVADKPVKRYLDRQYEPKDELPTGTRIAIDKRFGFRMAYDLHAKELKSVEVCVRRHILGIFPELEVA